VVEGQAWGLADAADRAESTLAAVLQLANTETPANRAYVGLARDISRFAGNLLAGLPIGMSDHYR